MSSPRTIASPLVSIPLWRIIFLGQPSKMTFAVSTKSNLLKQMILHPSEGIYRIEIWKYDPKKLSKCAYVDPLSLMLSYKDSDDERINKEIEQLESKIL
jgi:hypothetical protein